MNTLPADQAAAPETALTGRLNTLNRAGGETRVEPSAYLEIVIMVR